jgi:predicted unusual protein kinase regulating ubiquinone biosynthesis (AarF/ABC1/UbiB family)
VSEDWEKLAGEQGERVTSSRFKRMFKLGSVGAGVAASSMAGKVKSLFGGETSQDDLSAVYSKNAGKIADVLGELKGASMKVGQLLSADPELLPPEFADGLESLQRSAPPMTYMTVKEQIEKNLDRPIGLIFKEFDPEPIGSASIGQVHRAKLDSGEDVAVKIQYPGVADALESDLKTLKSMLTAGRAVIDKERIDRYFVEVRDILMDESDYRLEAANLDRFRDRMADNDFVRIPKPFHEWTSKEVITMEYVEGEKLDHALAEMPDGPEKNELLEKWVGVYVWLFHENHEIHADPHPGNFLLDDQGRLVMLDFGSVKQFEPEFTDGILEVLNAYWDGEDEKALETYHRLGFHKNELEPDVLAAYHDIVLACFARDEPFDFGSWKPAAEGRKYALKHPSLMTFSPPSEAILYFRLLSGVKGMLFKLDATINVHKLAWETSIRRGIRPG